MEVLFILIRGGQLGMDTVTNSGGEGWGREPGCGVCSSCVAFSLLCCIGVVRGCGVLVILVVTFRRMCEGQEFIGC